MYRHSQYSNEHSDRVSGILSAITAEKISLTNDPAHFEDVLTRYFGEDESKAVAQIICLAAQGKSDEAKTAAQDLIHALAVQVVEA